MPKDLEEAAQIVLDLQEWIEDRDGLGSIPIANLSWARDTLQISVGDYVVYCDQNTNGEDFNLESCKMAWLDYVADLRPFADEAIAATLGGSDATNG